MSSIGPRVDCYRSIPTARPEAVTVTTSAENESIARTLRDGLQSIGFDASLKVVPNATDIEVWIGRHAFKQQP